MRSTASEGFATLGASGSMFIAYTLPRIARPSQISGTTPHRSPASFNEVANL
ncbi:hypothetical protein FACS189485_01970 [Spirochaetia bacterium]|nr:hypothetical protein FACS189485_01970 [Spirochaetia bacterium]